VDNRTGFRRRGHGFLADQARQALGMAGEAKLLADIPAPLVHTAFGAAVCAVAILMRPEALGLQRSAIASGCLAVFTGLALVAYDFLVYPAESRPGLEGAALPVAAVASFATVLAGVTPIAVRLAAGVVAAIVIGGVPHLAGRRVTGREGWATRFGRDAAGVAVLAPVLVAASSPVLPPLQRAGLVAAVALLVSIDGLRTERIGVIRALLASAVVGLIIGEVTLPVATATGNAGLRAAALLVLWYGLRGELGVLVTSRRNHWTSIAEYGIFVLAAAVALGLIAARNL